MAASGNLRLLIVRIVFMQVDPLEECVKRQVLLLCAALFAVAVPTLAHHSFGVNFDANKPVTITGVVTSIDWRNPHTHLFLDVKDDSGKVVNWKLEGYPPNVLARTGWKRDVTVKVGDTITIFGWRARDGSPFAHLREATLASGKRLYFGPPAGTGEGGAVAGR
jgi:hypothetical protein